MTTPNPSAGGAEARSAGLESGLPWATFPLG